jgi:pyruvate formate lyase activating enzyme
MTIYGMNPCRRVLRIDDPEHACPVRYATPPTRRILVLSRRDVASDPAVRSRTRPAAEGLPAVESHAASFWRSLPDGRIQCEACPRGCRLRDGQRGFCFVRARSGDRMVLTTHGRSSGFCVDPIEKKPLAHFLPGTAVLSFGTAGCNLACRFCQNWDISASREWHGLADAASPEAIAAAALRLGCRSVAATYNDPVIFNEYAVDTALACRELGIAMVLVTAGYVAGAAREHLFTHVDAVNVDLKAFSETFYRDVCGGRLTPVLDTLEWLANATGTWLEVTTLLVPGLNDSDAEIEALTRWVADRLGPGVPLHLTAFHPDWRMRDRPATPFATLSRARAIGLANGLRHVYTGNVRDPDGGSTWCHVCGTRLIGRSGYAITGWALDGEGRCRRCGEPCAGVFEASPGTWGPRRLPVRLGG